MASKILITKAGRNALFNADRTGTGPVKLASVGYGTGKYTATESMTALKSEFKRLSTIAGVITDDSVISLRVLDRSADTYTVNEFGIYTDTGVLFAIYSQTDSILMKAAESVSHLAIDIKVEDINVASIAFGDTNFEVPQATTEGKGVVELATIDEALIGDDEYRAVTPVGLNARVGVTENFIQEDVMASINALNERVSQNTITPFCVNQGPMSAEGLPQILGFVNDVAVSTEIAFVQPAITKSGGLGGSAFAVTANTNESIIQNAFNPTIEDEFNSYDTPSTSSPVEITIYNPTALKLKSITFELSQFSSRIFTNALVYGSNTNGNWTQIAILKNNIRTASTFVDGAVNATVAYKYIKISFTSNDGNDMISFASITLNATTMVTHNKGRLTFRAPIVATTAQSEKFTIDAVSGLDLSQTTAKTVYVYLNRAGVPIISNGFHEGETAPSSYQTGDVWLRTLEPLNSYYWSGSEWVQTHLAPVGEVYLDGTGKITGVSTYPYNQNGYTVNINTQATPSTFGLMRVAAVEDEVDCSCNDASVTPANFMSMGDYRIASKVYKVGERVRCLYHADLYLQCTKAGTTSADALDTHEVTLGQLLTDGGVTWLVVDGLRFTNVGEGRDRSSKKPTYGLI